MTTNLCAPPLVDSHCHPHFPQFDGDIAAVRSDMRAHGVCAALAVATCRDEFAAVKGLAADYAGEFFAACAVHPNTDEEMDADAIAAVCADDTVVAVGETGLDYFWREGEEAGIDKAVQRRRFAAHIDAARRLKKPLIIHTRDSLDDALDVLAGCGAQEVGGVLHCWTGDVAGARRALDIGFCLSFTGIVGFKNADSVRETAAFVPADRYMVETDSPYLAPVPHRGQRNTPGWVRHVAAAMAAARGCDEAQVCQESSATFERLFGVKLAA